MSIVIDLDRPLCPVPGCERLCQLASKPGKGDVKTQYLKTCNRHTTNDIPINKPITNFNSK